MKYYCSFPSVKSKKDNPVLSIISNYLCDEDWVERKIKFRTLDLFKNRNDVKILWFHWPNAIWRNKRFLLKYISLTRFLYHVFLSKSFGYKLVWSAHNVMPHEAPNSLLELLIRKIIVKTFDLVIGHANNTLAMLNAKRLMPNNYILAVHGHYEDFYSLKNTSISREKLNVLDDDFLLLLNSGGKNYKMAANFVDDFLDANLDKFKLLIYGAKIIDAKNIITIPGFISNEDLAQYLTLSDIVCLPYEEITTSGAYFLALTFNKPILAKKNQFFIEHASKNTAVLYEDTNDLKRQLVMLSKGSIIFDNTEFKSLKMKFTWSKSVKIIAEAFNKLD